ncbi:Polypyrimidine Tract-Binding Protein 3 [Manis pentadactyla]|nr:Polypyrimidine Tract-Binding Protein 3 [Manis pentadactyla]
MQRPPKPQCRGRRRFHHVAPGPETLGLPAAGGPGLTLAASRQSGGSASPRASGIYGNTTAPALPGDHRFCPCGPW